MRIFILDLRSVGMDRFLFLFLFIHLFFYLFFYLYFFHSFIIALRVPLPCFGLFPKLPLFVVFMLMETLTFGKMGGGHQVDILGTLLSLGQYDFFSFFFSFLLAFSNPTPPLPYFSRFTRVLNNNGLLKTLKWADGMGATGTWSSQAVLDTPLAVNAPPM